MHTNATKSQRIMNPTVPLTVTRLRLCSFGRARMTKNCKAASLDR